LQDADDIVTLQAVLFGASGQAGNQTAVLVTLSDPVYDSNAQVRRFFYLAASHTLCCPVPAALDLTASQRPS